MPSHKIERIASDISRNISDILANEANDSLLKTITVTVSEKVLEEKDGKFYDEVTEKCISDFEVYQIIASGVNKIMIFIKEA